MAEILFGARGQCLTQQKEYKKAPSHFKKNMERIKVTGSHNFHFILLSYQVFFDITLLEGCFILVS